MAKTAFQAETHGFAFVNSWRFDPREQEDMQRTVSGSVDGAAASMSGSLSHLGSMLVRGVLQQVTANLDPVDYGLCGGMAFAALDYFREGSPPPRGVSHNDQPRRDTPDGALLRDYLWRRQLESMAGNMPTLLFWMGMLHINLPGAAGGPRWLLERTKEQWQRLKADIDAGAPRPICLVGPSHNPFHNHQVLASGYDDPGDGTGVLYLYDMNCPGKEQTTRLDFRGHELVADETCSHMNRTPLRGFFCEDYFVATPPKVRVGTGEAAEPA